MKLSIFLLLNTLLLACSTPPSPRNDISLNDVESLRIGNTTKAEAEHLFGKASQILSPSPNNQSWVYKNKDGAQTASLTFNESGVLIGAIWVPSNPQKLLNLQEALAHFKSSKFKTEKVGWDDQGHYYSEDVRYFDEKNGISFLITSSDQCVMMVGFSASAGRLPAKQ